uniref:Uncharacterized protein n=1 Tax=Lepeophtheirus salmonis TaxID=72036 RepID=A0A0K2SW26_LEPSM
MRRHFIIKIPLKLMNSSKLHTISSQK